MTFDSEEIVPIGKESFLECNIYDRACITVSLIQLAMENSDVTTVIVKQSNGER